MHISRVIRVWAAVLALCAQLIVGLTGNTTPGAAQTPSSTPIALDDLDPSRLIVVLKPVTTTGGEISVMSTASAYANRPGVTVSHRYTRLVKGFAGNFDQDAIKALVADPNVAAIYPDIPFYPQAQET